MTAEEARVKTNLALEKDYKKFDSYLKKALKRVYLIINTKTKYGHSATYVSSRMITNHCYLPYTKLEVLKAVKATLSSEGYVITEAQIPDHYLIISWVK